MVTLPGHERVLGNPPRPFNTFRRPFTLLALLFLVRKAPAAICAPISDTGCSQSTVEQARGAEFASRAKTFLAELQAAVAKKDKAQFASLAQYPLRFNAAHRIKITTPAELIKRYSTIVTPQIRNAILDQSPSCLFGNYQGVMIGAGEVGSTSSPTERCGS